MNNTENISVKDCLTMPAFTFYQEYLYVCELNDCAASLIHFFEYHHNKLKAERNVENPRQSHHKNDIIAYICGFYGPNNIALGIEKLIKLGIITRYNETQFEFHEDVLRTLFFDLYEIQIVDDL
jgi:hypothetical protein